MVSSLKRWLILATTILGFSIPNHASALESHLEEVNEPNTIQRELDLEAPAAGIMPPLNGKKALITLKTSIDREKHKLRIEVDPEANYYFNAQVGEPTLRILTQRYIDVECLSQRAQLKSLLQSQDKLEWVELKPNEAYATVVRSLGDLASGEIEGGLVGKAAVGVARSNLITTIASKIVDVTQEFKDAKAEREQDQQLTKLVNSYYVVEIPNFANPKNPTNISAFSRSWELDYSVVDGVQLTKEPKFFAILNVGIRDVNDFNSKAVQLPVSDSIVEFASQIKLEDYLFQGRELEGIRDPKISRLGGKEKESVLEFGVEEGIVAKYSTANSNIEIVTARVSDRNSFSVLRGKMLCTDTGAESCVASIRNGNDYLFIMARKTLDESLAQRIELIKSRVSGQYDWVNPTYQDRLNFHTPEVPKNKMLEAPAPRLAPEGASDF